jgi:hypothetical protein
MSRFDLFGGKSFDDSCPLGPKIVRPAFVPSLRAPTESGCVVPCRPVRRRRFRLGAGLARAKRGSPPSEKHL